MSRIEPSNTFFAKAAARGAKVFYGREMNSARTMATHPRLLFAYMRFNRAVERCPHLPKSLAELGSLRAATRVGCEFCMDIGSEMARRSGLSEEQLLALHEAHDSDLFDPDQLLVIDLADGMTATPGDVSDELMGRVRERFGVKGTMEIVEMIAWENTRARINIALEMPPDGFSTGKACARPVAVAERAAA